MKKQIFIVLIAFLFACNNQEKKTELGMPVIDVSKSYTEKIVALQDIANIEYIPLETRDDVLLEEWARIDYISKDTIIVSNSQQGDIFIFNGQGKFLSKFNKKGQSGTEYLDIAKIIFIPKNQEIFVMDTWNKKKTFVYDIKGNHIRNFDIDQKYWWQDITNYNDSLLLCYDTNDRMYFYKKDEIKDNPNPYMFISKKDGSLISNLDLQIDNRIKTIVVTQNTDKAIMFRMADVHHIINYENDEFIINDISLDTIYRYTADQQLVPFFVKQPPVQSMPEDKKIWLDIKAISNKYIFLQTTHKSATKEKTYESTNLMLDRKTNEIFQCKLENVDFKTTDEEMKFHNKLLSVGDLKDKLEESELSGELKTIAEKIGLDDNPVIMKISMK